MISRVVGIASPFRWHSPSSIAGSAPYAGLSQTRPELIISGGSVAEDCTASFNHLAVAPMQDMDHVDVEFSIWGLAGIGCARAVAQIVGDIGGVVVAGHHRDRLHAEAVGRQR